MTFLNPLDANEPAFFWNQTCCIPIYIMVDSTFELTLPYIAADADGVGGDLRTTPDHFVVEEVPLYEPDGAGAHLYVNLTKVELSTKEVQSLLAAHYCVDKSAIGFAGMKDKHARTTQTFSLPLDQINAARFSLHEERIAGEIESALPVTVHWVKRHRNKLKAGHLLGNRFRITISNLDCREDEALKRFETIAHQIRRTGVPNYFGPQRFGINGANVARGFEVLTRRKHVRDRWLRRFLVSSYQSYLCNRYLAARIEQGAFHKLLAGDVAKKYDTGGLFEVTDLDAEAPRYEAKEISFTAPMFGPKMKAATGAAGHLEAAILAETPLSLDHFRRAKADGSRRLGRLLLPDIRAEAQSTCRKDGTEISLEVETSLVVYFFLPKGAFATTVLREIMKRESLHVPEE